jgi:hypothetical protein
VGYATALVIRCAAELLSIYPVFSISLNCLKAWLPPLFGVGDETPFERELAGTAFTGNIITHCGR